MFLAVTKNFREIVSKEVAANIFHLVFTERPVAYFVFKTEVEVRSGHVTNAAEFCPLLLYNTSLFSLLWNVKAA